MEIGILGLPQSGKTTIFQALTRSAPSGSGPHLGAARVPEPRLQALAKLFQPKRITAAEVRYVDLGPPPAGFGKGQGLGGTYLDALGKADVLLLALRAFAAPAVPHPSGSVDPGRDMETMELELAFADLGRIEKRLQRLADSLKAAKPAEREAASKERSLLEGLKKQLEAGQPLRATLGAPQLAALAQYQFLTAKPLLILLNLGEEDLPRALAQEEDWRQRRGRPGQEIAALCAHLEREVGELEEAEAATYRTALGLGAAARERVLQISYRLLGLTTFFTVGSDEVRAWAVPRDTLAPRAAGKIHTDMERGFIRAEVIGCRDLLAAGSLAAARKQGLVRLEGKDYRVQDGDVLTILFNL